MVCWNSVIDSRFSRYRLEMVWITDGVPRDSLFEIIDDCMLTDELNQFDTCRAVSQDLEDTIWYRVRWAQETDSALIYSPASEPQFSIRDVTRPLLLSLAVTRVYSNPGGRPTADVEYHGTERYPAFLLLSEHVNMYPCDTFSIDSESGTVTCTLSCDEERKYIFGQMIDKAGNASDIGPGSSTDVIIATRAHNYPNPFSPIQGKRQTTIVWDVPEEYANGNLEILIYDLFGNLVNKLPGSAVELRTGVTWDGTNQRGITVADGGYICVIKSGDEVVSRHKIAVAK